MRSIHDNYKDMGPKGFYTSMGSEYRNPHEEVVRGCLRKCVVDWNLDITRVLDLACGSGEVTLEILDMGGLANGIDPYTNAAYKGRTGQEATVGSFESIANGGLPGQGYSLVVCSYAMHLVDLSWLPRLVYRLGEVSDHLLILSPHKRPDLTPWARMDRDMYQDRVRARLYNLRGLPTPVTS